MNHFLLPPSRLQPAVRRHLRQPVGAIVVAVISLAWFPLLAQARLARIISIQGNVELQRADWQAFQRAHPGTALYGPDVLQPSRGSRVLVICPSGSRWLVPAGTISAVNNGCPGTPSALKPQFEIGDLAGGSDPAIPYIITPRLGTVLSATPLLSWNPVEGAETYTVTLQTRRGPVWTIEMDQTTIPYPENQPPLMPGTTYTLVVEANTGTASIDEGPEIRFNLLGGKTAESAESEIAAINAMDISDQLKTIMLVENVYARYDLAAAAITDLEKLIATGCETAQIRRLLGDWHLKSGLRLRAIENYQNAIALAEASENLEEQVLSQYALGILYVRTENLEAARVQLLAAQTGAQQLGDSALSADIHTELESLL